VRENLDTNYLKVADWPPLLQELVSNRNYTESTKKAQYGEKASSQYHNDSVNNEPTSFILWI
jgi:hypothetical protein